MSESKNPLVDVVFETKGVPTVYCNHVSPSISFNDIRIYLAEVTPKQLDALISDRATATEPMIEPRLCVVVAPEFAKAFSEVLMKAVTKYESIFGPLRHAPSQEQVS